MNTSITERARLYIAKCPRALSGLGGHNTTFYVACTLVHGFALDPDAALNLLREWNQTCQPPWSEPELIHKIKSAANATHLRPRGYLLGGCATKPGAELSWTAKFNVSIKPKPTFRPDTLERLAKRTSSIGDIRDYLATNSPINISKTTSSDFLRHLYPSGCGEAVLLFSDLKSQGQALWDAKNNPEMPSGPEGVWYLPQPVDGLYHPNPRNDGKLSRRSEESVTSWRYLVLESDEADEDMWLRVLVQLPLRIVSICESGGRSIHALIRVDAASKLDWDCLVREAKPILVTLGADAGALTAIRLTRLPQAHRGARVQKLLYLSPNPDDASIWATRSEVL